MSSKLRQIAVDEKTYFALKRLGETGDSFNDVIRRILNKLKELQPVQEDGGTVQQHYDNSK